MSQKQSYSVWLKDLLDQVKNCHEQLEWTHDPMMAHLLTETMLRDLETCKRICETIKSRIPMPAVA